MDDIRDDMIITTARFTILALVLALAALVGVVWLGCRQRGYVRKDAPGVQALAPNAGQVAVCDRCRCASPE